MKEILFILDKSGSMEGLEKDVIGGFNSLIKKIKDEEGYFTLLEFDENCEIIIDREEIKNIKPLKNDDYQPCGCTALFDAIGIGIHHIDKIHKYLGKDNKIEETKVYIYTDGYENSSREYNSESLKKIIDQHKERNFTFDFIGATQDCLKQAREISIDNTYLCAAQSDGIEAMYDCLGASIKKKKK